MNNIDISDMIVEAIQNKKGSDITILGLDAIESSGIEIYYLPGSVYIAGGRHCRRHKR